jgi:hypothetical protein
MITAKEARLLAGQHEAHCKFRDEVVETIRAAATQGATSTRFWREKGIPESTFEVVQKELELNGFRVVTEMIGIETVKQFRVCWG